MANGKWSDDRFLDGLRAQGDSLADAAIERLVAEHGERAIGPAFRALQATDTPLPPDAPPALHARGLGDIRLKSALNQPFDAEIQLVDAAPEELVALRASIASNDTFARYGLDRPAYLSEFTFAVDRNPSGQSVLRVTSPRPVTEPFVTFLIDANWPRGRLLREYTVLLDPPVYAPGPAVAEAPVAT